MRRRTSRASPSPAMPPTPNTANKLNQILNSSTLRAALSKQVVPIALPLEIGCAETTADAGRERDAGGAEGAGESRRSIVSNVFGIDVSALQAFQQAIAVTSNNVANASTPGYDEESIDLSAAAPQESGGVPIGAGVVVSGVSRAYSQAAANQLNTSQSSLGQLTALQNYTSQIDNLFGTTADGLSTRAAELLQRVVGGRRRSDIDRRAPGAARRRAGSRRQPQHHEHPAQWAEFGRQYAHRRPTCSRSIRSAPRSRT